MLGEIFYWVFNMSIAASVTGVIVILIRKIKRIPIRISYFLWVIPFLRMWLPVGLGSKFSFMSLISNFTSKTVVVYEGSRTFTMMNHIMAADSYFPITYKANMLEDLFNTTSVIWAIIAAAIIIAIGILYFVTKAELKGAKHIKDNVYLSDKITSPAVYGIIRPKIILPSAFEEKELKYILAHEKTHIKNGDNLLRMVAFVTAAVHWFNPLSWLFLRSFLADAELYCDEKLISKYDEDEKKAYAISLLECAESKNIFASAFGGAKIRIRFDSILSYKRLSLFSLICFIALAFAIAFVLLTNAV